jgi:2,4-dienoyl-CoA reductase-like NADH-dependent reductase (Old Yellow Enzyme family)
MSLLFEPLTLRDVRIRNRIWLSPMCQYACDNTDGLVGDWHLVHYGARAAGGFGLLLVEASAIRPDGRITPQCSGLWSDAHAEAWARVVTFGQRQGAAMGVQLAHAGRKASTSRAFPGEPAGLLTPDEGGWQVVGPSPVAFDDLATPHELSTTEIDLLIKDWANAARLADAAGFDVVEIHAAHGYLLHEFYSPLSNLRTDNYGGAGRTRLLLEVVEAVREVWPERKPLFVRLSVTEWLDHGWSVSDSVALAAQLRDRGVDLIDCSSGGNAVVEIPTGPGYQVHLAAAVRETGIPTTAVGLITDPQQAEGILQAGHADAIFLGRVALREPAWPHRAAAALDVDYADAHYPPQYIRGRWPT